MKKFLLIGITLMVSAAMLMIACKKDEPSKNNTETTDTDYVDLGLPSGTKWKSTNETGGHNGFYTFDEAVSTFGDKLPTKEQFEELKNNCTWEQQNDGSFKVTGTNGKSIVLPVVGYCDCENNVYGVGSAGGCWSSTPESGHAWCLLFDSIEVGVFSNTTCNGRSVRLVKK